MTHRPIRATTALVATLSLLLPQAAMVPVAQAQERIRLCEDLASTPPCPEGEPRRGRPFIVNEDGTLTEARRRNGQDDEGASEEALGDEGVPEEAVEGDEAADQAADEAARIEAEQAAEAEAQAEGEAQAQAEDEARQAAEEAARAEAELAVQAEEAAQAEAAQAEADAAQRAADEAAVAEVAAEAEAQARAIEDAEAQAEAEAEEAGRAEAEAAAQQDAEEAAAQQEAEARAAAEQTAAEEAAAQEAEEAAVQEAEDAASREAEAADQERAAETVAEDEAVRAEAEAAAQAEQDDARESIRAQREQRRAEREARRQARAEAGIDEAEAEAAAQAEADRAAEAAAEAAVEAEAAAGENADVVAEEESIDPTVEEDAAPVAAASEEEDEVTSFEEEVETVAADDVRESDEDFATDVRGEADASDEDDDGGLSNLEKALLVGLGTIAVGALLDNGQEIVANSGDRVVARNPDGDYFVYRDDDALLRQEGNEVRTQTFDDGSTRTIVERPNGTQIVTIRDAEGRVLRRARVLADGTQVVLLDDTEQAVPVDVIRLREASPPPVIVSADDADEETLRRIIERPVAYDPGRTFTLRQIREIAAVRNLVPGIDLDAITFASGSAAIPSSQLNDLVDLGLLIEESLENDPSEVFLVEGHTDAVGSEAFNLALSDRRAETVALALTENFAIPPENLVVQGYGEEFLKVPTLEDEQENRRATIRRITPLLQARGSVG